MMKDTTVELISALRLMLIMGLVWVHFGPFPGASLDPFTGVYQADYFVPSSLNSFFVYFFLSAVPVLSTISGYLLSFKGKPAFMKLLKKRAITVLLPSIIWTSLWLAFAFTLYTLGKENGSFTYYDYHFSDFTYWTMLDGIFGLRTEPFAFQFWFIHDLILSLIFSPLIYFLIKRVPLLYFLIVGGLWFIGWTPPIFYYLKVTIFFSFGIILAQKNWQPSTLLPNYHLWIGLFVSLILIRIYTPIFFEGKMPYESMFEATLRASGVIAVTCIGMLMRKNIPKTFSWLSRHSGYAFFIFAAQFPTVILIKEVLARVIGTNSALKQSVIWILTPILTISIIIIAASLLAKHFKALFKVLNGQRTIIYQKN